MRLLIIGIPNFIGADKEFEGIINILIIESFHLHVLNLLHALLLMTAELEITLIAP